MIIHEEKVSDSKIDDSMDPPPTYSTSTSTQDEAIQPKRQPCNFVSFVRHNSAVRGSWTIDPAMYIPSALMPPLQRGETEDDRKNLRLESHNGSVDADILLIEGNGEGTTKGPGPLRTTLSLNSHNGSIVARVSDMGHRRPVYITAKADNCSITLYVPRSFQGLMSLSSKNGSIVFSEQFSQRVTTFSDMSSTRRCFVGDLGSWVEQDSEWSGDEVVVCSHNGKVRVLYIDEVIEKKEKKNFLSRVFKI